VFRPLVETVRDTLAWYDGLPDDRREAVAKRAGLAPEKEAEVLKAWHAKHG
jgi:2'-hydroxyisoflavone reductase